MRELGQEVTGEAFLENLVTPGAGRCHNAMDMDPGSQGRVKDSVTEVFLFNALSPRGLWALSSGWPGCTRGSSCVLYMALVQLCLPALGKRSKGLILLLAWKYSLPGIGGQVSAMCLE